MKIVIFANIVHTNTLTGGDKIFIECAKRWIAAKHSVTIVTNEVGKEFCLQNGIESKNVNAWKSSWADAGGVYFAMIVKAIVALLHSFTLNFKDADIAFASSFFFPDLFPAYMLKRTNPDIRFVIASYLFTYKKWGTDYSAGKSKGFLFYLNQILSLELIKKYRGKIITASAYDKDYLVRNQHIGRSSIFPIRGGVDNAFFMQIPPQEKKFDAVFVGRFHPQKCVADLIDIWNMVVHEMPSAILALVGNGQLEQELKNKVKFMKLQNNIVFLGPQDGVTKGRILKSSRVFISASLYDSGNIALDEALACGTPGVIYDLEHLDYLHGVVKIPVFNDRLFANAVISVLSDKTKREELSQEALGFAETIDWNRSSESVLNFMSS